MLRTFQLNLLAVLRIWIRVDPHSIWPLDPDPECGSESSYLKNSTKIYYDQQSFLITNLIFQYVFSLFVIICIQKHTNCVSILNLKKPKNYYLGAERSPFCFSNKYLKDLLVYFACCSWTIHRSWPRSWSRSKSGSRSALRFCLDLDPLEIIVDLQLCLLGLFNPLPHGWVPLPSLFF